MIIKVCGMRDPGNIRAVEEAGADWLGFIFFAKSPRYVDQVPSYLPERAKRVGVFVNATEDDILRHVEAYRLDLVQLHGRETPELCSGLRGRGIRVMKVFYLRTPEDITQLTPYNGCADLFHFDTPCPEYGGSGRGFDWSLLSHYKGDTPFMLSGGLKPSSLEALAAFSHPQWMGIDINSGFETAPAMKDPASIRDFINRFKSKLNNE